VTYYYTIFININIYYYKITNLIFCVFYHKLLNYLRLRQVHFSATDPLHFVVIDCPVLLYCYYNNCSLNQISSVKYLICTARHSESFTFCLLCRVSVIYACNNVYQKFLLRGNVVTIMAFVVSVLQVRNLQGRILDFGAQYKLNRSPPLPLGHILGRYVLGICLPTPLVKLWYN